MSSNKISQSKQPVLFVGHGTPMNAIESNNFTKELISFGQGLPRPKSILCISAHWLTNGTYVNVSTKPKMVYDMYGFPDELYKVQYTADGSPETATEIQELISKTNVLSDTGWGYDHGAWSILKHLFPKADVPVFQMSIDYNKPMRYHYELAQELLSLRDRGVMVIGSGNITHNIRMVDLSDKEAPVQDWAQEFDSFIKNALDKRDHTKIINYSSLGKSAKKAVPEPSHLIPLIYAISMQADDENVSYFYDKFEYGTLSMRSLIIQ